MSSFSTLFIFLILLLACSEPKKMQPRDTPSDEPKKTMESTVTDTIPNPPLPPASQLGPGQAKISGEVTAIKDRIMYLRVESVLEYGSSTSPIAPNDTLAIQVGKTNFDQGSREIIIIQRNLSSGSIDTPGWSFIKLVN